MAPTVVPALVNRQIPYQWNDAGVAATPSSSPSPQAAAPLVVRISPMAHFAVGFLTLGLLAAVLSSPLTAPVLILPLALSAMIVRLRTVADAHTVTVRTLSGGRTVDWDDVEGLRFVKSSWARAKLTSGEELRLPAVTFSTLPLLAEVSGGRVPNPYG
jgi:hypothetical protein